MAFGAWDLSGKLFEYEREKSSQDECEPVVMLVLLVQPSSYQSFRLPYIKIYATRHSVIILNLKHSCIP